MLISRYGNGRSYDVGLWGPKLMAKIDNIIISAFQFAMYGQKLKPGPICSGMVNTSLRSASYIFNCLAEALSWISLSVTVKDNYLAELQSMYMLLSHLCTLWVNMCNTCVHVYV